METTSSLISIIVPVYNSSKTLNKCVQSLLVQTYSNIEIILVNDGSKDDSLSLCYDLSSADKKIKVITQQNSGVSAARNNGINHASGDWICFVDSDDFVDATYIADFGYKKENGESILYLQGYQHNYENSDKVDCVFEKPGIYNLHKDAYSLFENTNFINLGTVCSKLYNRNLIIGNNLCFNQKMRLNEDNCFFWNYVSSIEKVSVNNTCGYHYMHAKGINHSKSHKNYKEYIYIMTENKSILNRMYAKYGVKKLKKFRKNYNQYIANIWLHALVAFFLEPDYKNNDYGLVHRYKSEIVNYYPESFYLKLFKIILRMILLLPQGLQKPILSAISKCIVMFHIFYI